VLTSLASDDGQLKPVVDAWLTHTGSRPLLDALQHQYIPCIGQKWPSNFSTKTFHNMVRHTLYGLQADVRAPVDQTYLITSRLRLLHKARMGAIAAAKAAKAKAATGCASGELTKSEETEAAFNGLCVWCPNAADLTWRPCSLSLPPPDTTRHDRILYITELWPFESHLGSDHYNEHQPGPLFQLHLLYRLVLLLERLNVLEARPPAVDCAICLTATVAAAGESWHQLEPCRHWLCGRCGESWMQEQAQHSCPMCRARIVLYVRAKSGV